MVLDMNLNVLISIHAPREGSDPSVIRLLQNDDISIHAPREGSDRSLPVSFRLESIFQSTLPVRGATGGNLTVYGYALISIHAPREGSDLVVSCVNVLC